MTINPHYPAPTYLSQEVYEAIASEWQGIDQIISRVLYEEKTGGALRDLAGYRLHTGPQDGFIHIAPVRYFENGVPGFRFNGGTNVTTISIPAHRVVTITRERRA